MIVYFISTQITEFKPFYPHTQYMNAHENKGRPAEKKIPTVVVYKKPTGKKYYMLVTESSIDDVIDNTKRKQLIPSNFDIVDIGLVESFVETFKKQYNIK
jgi:mannose-1-phosphate guanylyltransferase